MLVALSSWAVEIDCKTDKSVVKYVIAPSKGTAKVYPGAERREFKHPHANPETGPFFQARVLIRDSGISDRTIREWSYQTSGIRVYLEGFRVLPYGDRGNDWLNLDANTARRSWDRDQLTESLVAEEEDKAGDWQLLVLPNNSYTGAVFLTQEDAPTLRMLVNREGFVGEPEYDSLVEIVKRSLDLSTRTRAAATYEIRSRKSEERKKAVTRQTVSPNTAATPIPPVAPRPTVTETDKAKASLIDGLREATRELAGSKAPEAVKVVDKLMLTQSAAAEVIRAAESNSDSAAMSRVLSSLGTQMASFVHEINGMLGSGSRSTNHWVGCSTTEVSPAKSARN